MASQSSSAAETSGTNATAGSSLHHVIQVEPIRPVESSVDATAGNSLHHVIPVELVRVEPIRPVERSVDATAGNSLHHVIPVEPVRVEPIRPVEAGSSLHHVIPVEPVRVEPSQHKVEKLLNNHDWKNAEFKNLLVEYFNYCQNTINCAEAVNKHFNSLQSSIQDAEGSSSGVNWKAVLMKFVDDQLFADLDGVCKQEVDNVQSFQDDLSRKLLRAIICKVFYALGFTAVMLTAQAAVPAFEKKQWVISALTTLTGAFWSWTFFLLNKCGDNVKKYVKITGSMASSAKLTADVASSLRSSALQFATQIRSILEMAESAGAGEERKLVEHFQELRENAAAFCEDTHSARKCTFDSVNSHIWNL